MDISAYIYAGYTYFMTALLLTLSARVLSWLSNLRPAGVAPLTLLRSGQLLVVASLVVPALMGQLPQERGPWVAAQVFSGGNGNPQTLHIVSAVGGSAAAAPPSTDVSLPLVQVAATLLLVGITLAWVQLLSGMWRLRRHLHQMVPLHHLGRVSVVVHPHGGIPFSTGLFRRWVVLPLPLMVEHPHLFRVALHHELRHHRQGDTAWQMALEGVRAFYFWLPGVRSLQRDLGLLAELACDDAVIQRQGFSATFYGRCLLEVAQLVPRTQAVPAFAGIVTLTQPSQLKRRIDMLLSPVTRKFSPGLGLTLTLTLATFAGTAWATSDLVVDRRVSPADVEAIAARASSATFEVVANSHVQAALGKLVSTTQGQEFMRNSLLRMNEHKPILEQKLTAAGLPIQLMAVPLIESGFVNMDSNSKEMSLAPGMRGAGIWMFIPTTAEVYGLKVNKRVDQRLDVALETDAAVRLLSDLYKQFGSWPLALAGYNQGAQAVAKAITESGGERDVYKLIEAGKLNNYVPTVMAGVLFLNEPGLVQ